MLLFPWRYLAGTGRTAQKGEGGQCPLSSAVFLSVLPVSHQLRSRNIKQKIPEINNPQVSSSLPLKVTRWSIMPSYTVHLGHDLLPWPVYSVCIQPAHGSVGSFPVRSNVRSHWSALLPLGYVCVGGTRVCEHCRDPAASPGAPEESRRRSRRSREAELREQSNS